MKTLPPQCRPKYPVSPHPVTGEPSKACSKCAEVKPLSEFCVRSDKIHGHSNKCKPCTNRDYKPEWYDKYMERHRERILARARAASKTKPWPRERDPRKGAARTAIQIEVAAGRIVKPPTCERCGTVVPKPRLHAHHRDYSKPLDVEWLCSTCHGREHRTMPRTEAFLTKDPS